MLERVLWMTCGLLLAFALPGAICADAQPTPPEPLKGSVTVLSRPAGASFRLSGLQNVVGRTPMTVQRGLTGRYEVRGWGPGYETWRRTQSFSGDGADTVWMTLSRKNAVMGAARSLLVPGWGQLYNERTGHAWTMAGLNGGALAFLGIAQLRYLEREDIYNDLIREGSTNTVLVARAKRSLDDATDVREIALFTLAGAWGVNVLDALVFGPPGPAPGMQLGLVPMGPPGTTGAALSLRF